MSLKYFRCNISWTHIVKNLKSYKDSSPVKVVVRSTLVSLWAKLVCLVYWTQHIIYELFPGNLITWCIMLTWLPDHWRVMKSLLQLVTASVSLFTKTCTSLYYISHFVILSITNKNEKLMNIVVFTFWNIYSFKSINNSWLYKVPKQQLKVHVQLQNTTI